MSIRRRRYAIAMFCRACQYPLAQIDSHRCPECGRAFDRDNPKTFQRDAIRPWRRLFERIRNLVAGCSLISVFGFVTFFVLAFESWHPLSATRFYLPIVLGVAALAGYWTMGAMRSRWYGLPFILYATVLTAAYFIPIHPVKCLALAHREIRSGMTVAEVRAVIQNQFSRNKRFRAVERGFDGRCMVVSWGNRNAPFGDATTINVFFQDGVCEWSRSNPD